MSARSPITTHVLDTAVGKPAEGIAVALEAWVSGGSWKLLAKGVTNADGRVAELLPAGSAVAPGVYRLMFDTAAYFKRQGVDGFYPCVPVMFEIKDPMQHYHVPLLLNPFGYSTYRGS
jgi:5-hydroxyisourate hydrolase